MSASDLKRTPPGLLYELVVTTATHEEAMRVLKAISEAEAEDTLDFPLECSIDAVGLGKYENGYWSDDPDWPPCDWRLEVANGDTRLGYHEWVGHNRLRKHLEQ